MERTRNPLHGQFFRILLQLLGKKEARLVFVLLLSIDGIDSINV